MILLSVKQISWNSANIFKLTCRHQTLVSFTYFRLNTLLIKCCKTYIRRTRFVVLNIFPQTITDGDLMNLWRNKNVHFMHLLFFLHSQPKENSKHTHTHTHLKNIRSCRSGLYIKIMIISLTISGLLNALWLILSLNFMKILLQDQKEA